VAVTNVYQNQVHTVASHSKLEHVDVENMLQLPTLVAESVHKLV